MNPDGIARHKKAISSPLIFFIPANLEKHRIESKISTVIIQHAIPADNTISPVIPKKRAAMLGTLIIRTSVDGYHVSGMSCLLFHITSPRIVSDAISAFM